MTRSVASPYTRARCQWEIVTEALLLPTAFLIHCLKIFRPIRPFFPKPVTFIVKC